MITCLTDSDIERFIEEDVPYGDLATHLLGIGTGRGRIAFATRFGKPSDIGVRIQPV